ncbi:alpha/beta hydrolase [Chondromyces apiculatus]|uniref:Serine aminopeptidase S33 domain-containing protein n=1 Tax=Chondromyces apiculatus DSM 436 TaxID=1192034 RepID=A0A017TIY4_9BACT|nr:alpha/beta fold hydrolase [Chondromyces apiculatus]EYF08810.1 Hypothetical protein CAP_2671 [Chondromyces apiculatus DSM 436]
MSNDASLPEDEQGLTSLASQLVQHLSEQKFAEIVAHFDATMTASLPVEHLARVWEGLIGQVGSLKRVGAARVTVRGAYRAVLLTCAFEQASLDVKVAFDQAGQVAGLYFTPTEPPTLAWEAPAYADLSTLTEREVVVNAGQWPLPGTLTLPGGPGPFPAMVLIHGSGPQDRDATVGPNRPFKDLALGLATKGVAVLRFEKRTRAYGDRLDVQQFRMDQESIEDALAAVALLSREGAVDPAQIFVGGHSLGGTFAPRIGSEAPHLAGIAILAGATRPIVEMMREQIAYLASAEGKAPDQVNAQLDGLKSAGERIRALQGGAAPGPGEVILGAGAAYWRDVGAYDALATVKTLKMRIYVAQGQRDYQVTEVDYRAWEEALAGRKDVTLKLYPELNHLLMQGAGKSTPSEYQRPGHVDERLVDDLAGWMKGASGTPP